MYLKLLINQYSKPYDCQDNFICEFLISFFTLIEYFCPLTYKQISMTSIKNDVVILINVFTVEAHRQDELVELLTRATDGNVNTIKGFISATLHKSVDGTKVTMYAQWESKEDYENMRRNATASPFLEEALKFAEFNPGMYTIVDTFLPRP